MATQLKLSPDRPDDTQTVSLGGTVYQLRFFYRQRLGAWFMDLRKQDGTALALGRRLSPGWGPIAGIVRDDMPAGQLFVTRVPEPYERDDLGNGLYVRFYADAELPASSATLTTLTVT